MDKKDAIITDIMIETCYTGKIYRCLFGMVDVKSPKKIIHKVG